MILVKDWSSGHAAPQLSNGRLRIRRLAHVHVLHRPVRPQSRGRIDGAHDLPRARLPVHLENPQAVGECGMMILGATQEWTADRRKSAARTSRRSCAARGCGPARGSRSASRRPARSASCNSSPFARASARRASSDACRPARGARRGASSESCPQVRPSAPPATWSRHGKCSIACH